MRIGFIGLGAMGLPMTRHLLAAGHDVTVASRSRPPIDAAVAAGAKEGTGPSDVVAASEVTILCVPDSPDVVQVLDAAFDALGPGKIVVDTSTIDPEVERAQHERVTATGAAYLDAPLSGGSDRRRTRHADVDGRRRRGRPRRRPSRARTVRRVSSSTRADRASGRSSSSATSWCTRRRCSRSRRRQPSP